MATERLQKPSLDRLVAGAGFDRNDRGKSLAQEGIRVKEFRHARLVMVPAICRGMQAYPTLGGSVRGLF